MTRHDSRLPSPMYLLGMAAILGFTAVCYWPALTGPFIFDDIPNLSPLGDFGGVHSWDNFLHFVLGGGAGPLGRPVSLASFLLNAQDWPTSPYPFKLTNLVIHLTNGLLIYVLAVQLLGTQHALSRARQMALLAMAFWLLHPLLVSTTAFVVQRMTQLSCLFVLLGLIGYLHGRKLLPTAPGKGWLWIMGSLGSAGTLAIFSKESGVLLPLFALSIEVTIFSREKSPYKKWLYLLLGLPVLMLLGYMATVLHGIESVYLHRDFSFTERLLTQARILIDYLSRTLAPRMQGAGLYHDDFPISTGLLSPPGTLFSIIGLSLMLAAGWLLRRRLPFLSLGILWFFAGHSLESSIIPLELYYEHRNYLPIVGIAIMAAEATLATAGKLGKIMPWLALLFVILEAFITWQNAIMWSSYHQLVHITVREHPTSLRALERAALYYAAKRDYPRTLDYLEQAVAHHPQKNALKLSVIQTKCLLGKLQAAEVAEINRKIATGRFENEIIKYVPEFMRLAQIGVCEALNFKAVHGLLDALEAQAELPGPRTSMHSINYQRGLLFATEGHHEKAMRAMDAAHAVHPNIDIPLLQTVWMISVRDYNLAQAYLNKAILLNEKRSIKDLPRDADIAGLQGLIDLGVDNPEYHPFVYPLKKKATE